ncbi:monocarboxylate transporter 12-like [Liolophura sinensis]|uniref:monocarboxylate transporter 12-like n=1 Tax=Liolophura sinensis TaxID=3198878 RepID=UPI003159181B
MVATILCSIGFVSSAFVPRIEVLYLTIGVITGIGAGLTYTPTVVMVTLFFKKRRSFANGVTVAGNGIGYFLYPFLMKYLFDEYTLFGTLIIIGGVMLHSCIGAALLRPLESFRKKTPREMDDLNPEDDVNEIQGGATQEEVDTMFEKKNTKTSEHSKAQSENCCQSCVKNFSFKDIFDYTYLCNPVFLLFGLSFAFANMSYSNLFIVVPPHANECGVTKSQMALLVSMAGLADLFGRIIFGFVSDLKFVRRRFVYILGMLAGGTSALMAPLARDFATLAVYSCWYGLFGGSYWSLVAPLMADSFGDQQISKVFGLTTSFISIPSLLSPPILGWLRDGTGNWDMSFRIAGIWMLMAALFGLLVQLGERHVRRREAAEKATDVKDLPIA